MHWNRRYMLKSYISGSLWVVPFVALLLYWVVNRLTHAIDAWLERTGRIDEANAFYGLSMAGARSALETIVTLNLSFLVFTFGSLLVAIQIAGGQYTPRIIATTLLRDNAVRITVGYFVFTLMFAARVLVQMGDAAVNQLNTFITGVLGLGSIVVFLYLIDYAARLLRPVSIAGRVGESGIAVIQSVYPTPTTRPRPGEPSRRPASPDRIVAHVGTSGVVLAVDLAGLVTQAQRANGAIELVPQVGDFVSVDEPLFRLYGGASALDDGQLRAAIALGSERTMEQDPTFAVRILVDIAIKALSPAINEPCSASTSFTACCGRSVSGMSGPRKSATRPANRGWSSGRRTGRTLCTSPVPKYATAAQAASRSCGGCVRCWKTSCKPCRRIVMPSCASSWGFWIA